KQSLRTWVSCDVAAIQVGMHPIVIRNDQTGMGTRETPADVGRVLDRYLDAVGLRVFDHDDLEQIDRVTAMPVINLLSDREHPCQAIADLMTIEAWRPLQDVTVAYVGDGDNNVCRSLMMGAAMAGSTVRVGAPEDHQPDETSVAVARRHADVLITPDPREAVAGADVVYTDVWTSMGQEAEEEERRRVMSPFRVDESLFGAAAADAIFLHCLPAHRGEEVTDAVMDHPRSRVFDQAENRLHGFKAVLLHLLG
ncbi:MAG: ornithine carbamoyltransferase, partial [Acidimicrobiia bacterium]|nr:ornithine carbamoyltransferase [Acidimicrobiia bacterium]